MKSRKLSLANELGLLLNNLEIEKEEVIQSFMYLIREEGAEDLTENLSWRLPSISVNSPKVSLLIYQLIDFNLVKFSRNPGYFLTERGKELLLGDIPEDLVKKYNEHIERVRALGEYNVIVSIARDKYLKRKKEKYNVREGIQSP